MPVSLVTGGAGFMGSHVAEQLLKMGHNVVTLDDLSGGFVKRRVGRPRRAASAASAATSPASWLNASACNVIAAKSSGRAASSAAHSSRRRANRSVRGGCIRFPARVTAGILPRIVSRC